MKIFNCIFVVLTYLVISSSQPNNKIKISIYYETLCTDCITFIGNQLYPVHKLMRKYMKLDFVPYGKGRQYFDRKEKQWRFECQHGSYECYGNAVQACVLQQNLSDIKNLEFINCFLMIKNSTLCGKMAGINLNDMYNCMKRSNESSTYLAEYGSRTHKEVPDLDYVPWILVNGHYYNAVEKDLFRVMCTLTQNPEECSKSNKRRLSSLRLKLISVKKAKTGKTAKIVKKAKKTRKARKTQNAKTKRNKQKF